eukprot:9205015-Karenia_brevis.AAC.1
MTAYCTLVLITTRLGSVLPCSDFAGPLPTLKPGVAMAADHQHRREVCAQGCKKHRASAPLEQQTA